VEASPPPPTPQGPTRSSYTTRHYFAWVTYPRLVCNDPGELVDGLQVAARMGEPPAQESQTADLVSLASDVRHYRLSALGDRKFSRPLWCTVTYGPRLAAVTETESCTDGEANRWELAIMESPEVGAVWYGTSADMPAVPSLAVYWNTLVLAKQDKPTCCPGYFWCQTANGCLPNGVRCQEATPI
jgi:hypothetical protein